jgi:DNA-binding MarR family transcriptional regulator
MKRKNAPIPVEKGGTDGGNGIPRTPFLGDPTQEEMPEEPCMLICRELLKRRDLNSADKLVLSAIAHRGKNCLAPVNSSTVALEFNSTSRLVANSAKQLANKGLILRKTAGTGRGYSYKLTAKGKRATAFDQMPTAAGKAVQP